MTTVHNNVCAINRKPLIRNGDVSQSRDALFVVRRKRADSIFT